jgi:hypothetical protein
MENLDNVSENLHVDEQVQEDIDISVHAGDKVVFSVSYTSGCIASHVLRGVNCDACKTFLTSEVLLYTNVFMKQSLTYPIKNSIDSDWIEYIGCSLH